MHKSDSRDPVSALCSMIVRKMKRMLPRVRNAKAMRTTSRKANTPSTTGRKVGLNEDPGYKIDAKNGLN